MNFSIVRHSILCSLFVIVTLLVFKRECKSQELEVFIATEKNVYEHSDTILVMYWIENTTDSPIVFLEKSSLTVLKRCFSIYGANEELRRKDYGNIKKEDFITIEPNESIERTYPYMVYWLCRSAPPLKDWELGITYMITREEAENFYYEIDDEGNKEKVFMDAWTGTIESNIDEIIIERKNH